MIFQLQPSHSQPKLHTHCQAPRAKLQPKLVKEYAMPARVTAFQAGFRIAHAQKNKINLCFVDRFVQFGYDN